jgi:hypothetical protein
MQLNEFDKALRDRYESGSLPPDLAQWEQLVNRLDEYETAAIPAPKPRRGIIAYWPYWAAAASILLIGWLFLQETETLPIAKNQPAQQQPVPASQSPGGQQGAELANPAPAIPKPTTGISHNRTPSLLAASHTPRVGRRSTTAPTASVQLPVAVQTPVSAQTPTSARSHEDASAKNRTEADRPLPQVNLAMAGSYSDMSASDGYEPAERERRRLGVDVNGGYGPGSLKRNYTLGVSVHRKVGQRVQVEAGVAVVSGAYEGFNNANASSFVAGIKAAPQNISTRVTYLQAAPAVTYELLPGVFAGAGVDAQRLLTNANDATGYEYSGVDLETQPAWDFGYTLRAGYKVTRNFKAGLQYRNSMHVTAPVEGTVVQPRNYLMFQLGYTIH